jgi:hypothetical protein
MKLEDHCAESIRLFGKPFEDVHRWLDEFAGMPGYKMRHRRVRHHEAGLKDVEILFGQDAVPVAKQHIISDLKLEGWTEKDGFPKNEQDYKRLGFF